ncbi:hypothetical protein LEI94_11205 [Salmonella enterica]|nr:hypothetical protein [Salmonella enterica]
MILQPFLFDFGDSPNLPATSKKGRSSLTRARLGAFWQVRTYYVRTSFTRVRAFCQPARAGLALLQKSAIFGFCHRS